MGGFNETLYFSGILGCFTQNAAMNRLSCHHWIINGFLPDGELECTSGSKNIPLEFL